MTAARAAAVVAAGAVASVGAGVGIGLVIGTGARIWWVRNEMCMEAGGWAR